MSISRYSFSSIYVQLNEMNIILTRFGWIRKYATRIHAPFVMVMDFLKSPYSQPISAKISEEARMITIGSNATMTKFK